MIKTQERFHRHVNRKDYFVITYALFSLFVDHASSVQQNNNLNINLNLHSRHRRSIPNEIEAKIVLDKHNEFRATIGDEGEEPIPSNMRALTWDDGLATTSLTYAKKCIWKHSPNGERQTPTLNSINGENLWTGTGDLARNFDPIRGLTSWFNEYKDYDFENQTCVPGKKCGHYTQIVWAETYKLGCAWTVCPKLFADGFELTDAMYMICHYAPSGNREGEKLYKVGDRCSACNSIDTCPDNALCYNEERDAIIPLASNASTVAGALVGVILIIITLAAIGYYLYLNYGNKPGLLAVMRKTRRVSSSVDIVESSKDQKTSDDNLQSCDLPTITETDGIGKTSSRATRLSSVKVEAGTLPD